MFGVHLADKMQFAYNIPNATVKKDEPISDTQEDPILNEMKKSEIAQETVLAQDKLVMQILQETLKENAFFITTSRVGPLLKLTGLKIEEFLQKLIPLIKESALPPISNYKVGAVGLGKNGDIYLGVNLEFPGFQLNQSVHGEQFVVSNARSHGDTLQAIALSAAPCGHCRQFLNEIGDQNLIILTPQNASTTLGVLLTHSFGPKDLNVEGNLLTPKEPVKSEHQSPLIARAIEAALTSYAPYTHALSGVAIETKDGHIYQGSYLENAAFNPSLPPLQAALIALVAGNHTYADIVRVVLAERKTTPTKHAIITKAVVESIASDASFHLELIV